MKFNKRPLLTAKRQILDEPKNFIMTRLRSSVVPEEDLPRAECGTMFCIAGRICENHKCRHWEVGSTAANKILKLDGVPRPNWKFTSLVTDTLFFVDYWPTKEASKWYQCKTLKGRARIAAKRIDNFIKEVAAI